MAIILTVAFSLTCVFCAKAVIQTFYAKKWKKLGIYSTLLLISLSIAISNAIILLRLRESDKRLICMMNLKHLWQGLIMYAEDFQSNFPDDIYSIYPSYVPTANYFFCPGTPDTKNIKIITKENSHISYKYISGLTRNSASELLLLYDRENNHKGEGRNVLSVDGTTEWIPEDNWPAVWKMHTEKPALDTDTIGDKTI